MQYLLSYNSIKQMFESFMKHVSYLLDLLLTCYKQTRNR